MDVIRTVFQPCERQEVELGLGHDDVRLADGVLGCAHDELRPSRRSWACKGERGDGDGENATHDGRKVAGR